MESGTQYIVFEYLSGGTLAEYLHSHGPLSLEVLLRLGRQLCYGLAHLHKKGLVHRDVTTNNVWLDERREAHLGDFDSAIMCADPGELRPLTTNAFAAPEERRGDALDVRADLFSLGGLLYVAATGLDRPTGDPLQRLRSQRPDLPPEFADLVADLMSDSPGERPPDAESVRRRLDDVRYRSVDALIGKGESEHVEFKSSLHHRYGPLPLDLQAKIEQKKCTKDQAEKEVRKRLDVEITKTISAFLNSDGGTLLIGVDDSGTVLGIEPDFQYCQKGKQTEDGWLLSLRNTVIEALGPDVLGAIHTSLVRYRQGAVAVVRCDRRQTETWHGKDADEKFYIRAPSGSEELHGSRLVSYIHERWPT